MKYGNVYSNFINHLHFLEKKRSENGIGTISSKRYWCILLTKIDVIDKLFLYFTIMSEHLPKLCINWRRNECRNLCNYLAFQRRKGSEMSLRKTTTAFFPRNTYKIF